MKFRLPHALLESPWEVLIAFWCALTGIPLLLNGPAKSASSIDRVLPPSFVYVWGVVLFLGGVLILIGRIQRKTSYFRLERSGLILLSGATLIYCGGIVSVKHQGAIGAIIFLFTFSLACLIQYYKLGRAIKIIANVRNVSEDVS
jgi:hypothetical protein